MDCQSAIATLEECFDEGAQYSPELNRHLRDCQACRAKADELESLKDLLHTMPFEAPEGIEDRVKAVIRQERSRRNSPALVGFVVACAFVSASALNWFLPLRELENKLWDYMLGWIPSTEWVGSGRPYREQIEMAWMNGQGIFDRVEWFSNSMIWSALATAVVLLVALNAICTAQLRQTGQ